MSLVSRRAGALANQGRENGRFRDYTPKWPLARLPRERRRDRSRECDSQVDRTIRVEVLLISTAQTFLGAVLHETSAETHLDTHLTKGVSCPRKSTRSIRSCT